MVKNILFIGLCFAFIQCQTKDDTELPIGDMYSHIYQEEEDIAVTFTPPAEEELFAIENDKDEYKIDYGYSFGECIGYCECSIQFTSKGILKTATSWSDDPILRECFSIEELEYERLIKSIDFENLLLFSESLGCGDCADGGSETLRITYKGKTKSLSGTYGFQVEYVQELLDFLRTF